MTSSLRIILLTVALICIYFEQIGCKHYENSLENRLKLLDTEGELLDELKDYGQNLQDKIKALRRVSVAWRRTLTESKGKEEEYLSNPINSYSLMRQMVQDWEVLDKFIDQPVGQEQIEHIKKLRQNLPQLSDLNKAFEDMSSFVQKRNLYAMDLTKGLVDGVQSVKLSPLDCFSLGKLNLKGSFSENATLWLRISKYLLSSEPKSFYEVLGLTDSAVSVLINRTKSK